jgi:hypothetical protein
MKPCPFFIDIQNKINMQVKLKDENARITFNGRAADITKETLTLERYEWVKSNHPALLAQFEVIEDKEVKSKTKE